MSTTQNTYGVYQVEFIAFPGVEPYTNERDWPHLPLPAYAKFLADDDQSEEAGDEIMRVVDYALDNARAAFGFDERMDDYEPVNDLSIELAGWIHDALDGERRVKSAGGIWADWYQDVELTTGIVVRVAYFEKRATR